MKDVNHSDLPSSTFLITLIILACICTVIGVIGNLGVIIYNATMNHSKTPTTYFVVNLAIADILVTITFFPAWIAEFIEILAGTESEQKLTCRISAVSSAASIAFSMANLLAITMDRFIFIYWPLKYPTIMTWPRTYTVLVVVWLSVIINGNVLVFNIKETARRFYCRPDVVITLLYDVFNFFIPTVVVVFLNYKIFTVARYQGRRITNQISHGRSSSADDNDTLRRARMQQMKLIKTFAFAIGVFIFCILPFNLATITEMFICEGYCVQSSVHFCIVFLVGVNSIMNPFIYGARLRGYRKGYRQLFLQLCCGNKL